MPLERLFDPATQRLLRVELLKRARRGDQAIAVRATFEVTRLTSEARGDNQRMLGKRPRPAKGLYSDRKSVV